MPKRPAAIRIVCLLGFGRAAILLVLAFWFRDVLYSLANAEVPREVSGRMKWIFSGFLVYMLILLVSMVGMWLMRKWGPILYAALVAAPWLLVVTGKAPVGIGPCLDTILAPVALFYLRDMTWNAQPRRGASTPAVEQGDAADEVRDDPQRGPRS